jgi:hypothetical protein
VAPEPAHPAQPPVPAAPPAPALIPPPAAATDLTPAAPLPALPTGEAAPEAQPLALFESSVGYIDPAFLANQFRTRFDAAYDSNRPDRAEFIYAKPKPAGPGLPLPETGIDFQTLYSYAERVVAPRLSVFVNVPVRFLNPEVNANAWGLGDMDTGFKYLLRATPTSLTTFQLRTYIPTGNATKGLGTNHASLEPALLAYRRLAPRLRAEGELRYWVPAGGTDFAGDIVRYGLGLAYGARSPDRVWVSPVAEFVGWTVLGGKESFLVAPGAVPGVKGAAGNTIVDFKPGVRVGFGSRSSIYAGYARPLTGDVWYRNLWRVELRFLY